MSTVGGTCMNTREQQSTDESFSTIALIERDPAGQERPSRLRWWYRIAAPPASDRICVCGRPGYTIRWTFRTNTRSAGVQRDTCSLRIDSGYYRDHACLVFARPT